jgi:hypothetical protein
VAWTAPTTAISGAIATASLWNSDVRDNALALRATPFNRCSAYHNATQTITGDAAAVALSLNAEDYDTATMHDLVTNNSRITIPSGGSGFYDVKGYSVKSAANGTMRLQIHKNGVEQKRVELNATTITGMTIAWGLSLVAGDYVELYGFHGSNNADFGSATAAAATRLTVVGPCCR